ncbi:hypothetical protein PAXRUDRAFT_33808 [Paxillus rubicundulus Ve08.2h10]|uniref:Unplaced genomic scaffold scaffold_322, whole genome shotgun sequence n=1 Tax=Paxillus rubicundulus Ve08.2h10 TaxID=930991 RepID=A0A0D0DPL7_9AGAM|nr:hypothetical protein PAXRUDRAFT_33808 [Paxillus rubicundulus Ve08.2h10]
MPSCLPSSFLRYVKNLVAGGKLEEEEEREREQDERLKEQDEKIKGLTEANRKLKEEITQLKSLHKKTVEDSAKLQQSLRREKEEKTTIQQSQRREEEEKSKALSASQRLVTEASALRRQLEGKEIELKNLRNELQHSRTEHDALTTLLDARTRELKGAQAFLTKADTLSGAEVIALVEALNSEIMQTSAFISDSFDFARQPMHADEMKEASTRISELMGPTMTNLLGTVQHSGDPLLVQIALQGATVEFSRWIVMTWDYDGLQAEQPLAEIYNDIRETETQAVGGRWRALTRAHAQKVAMQETDLHSTMVAHISDTLVVILVAAGCTKNYEETYRHFTQKFGERISNIVKMSSRLNKAMGEDVTSADLWPTHATAGEKFAGATMQNFEGQDENEDGKTVLCTTALGLQRSEKSTQGDTAEFKTATLLKPKVALDSVAEGLEREEA